MAAWLAAAKAALPYVTNIVSAAIPAFTAQKNQEQTAELMGRQIAELQAAATRNAESVKTLAAQLEKTVSALEEGGTAVDQTLAEVRKAVDTSEHARAALERQIAALAAELAQTRAVAFAAMAVALFSAGLAVAALLR